MNCLHCGKPILDSASTLEIKDGWHKNCAHKFFGINCVPEINVSEEAIGIYVSKNVSKGLTVTGVQKKLSLNLNSDNKTKLTMVNYPTGYILKPQVEKFDSLPEVEDLAMNLASIAKIKTVPHGLINSGGRFAYITKRIDRVICGSTVKILAMEDFCQLGLRITEDKYKGSYEYCAKIINKFSSRPGIDLAELFIRLVFSYIIGNSDMHLKNISLIETDEGSFQYILSPAYDLLPVNIIMPEDKEELALTMNGKKRNLQKIDFFVFAELCGISLKSAQNIINRLISLKEVFCSYTQNSFLPQELKKDMIELINKRTQNLA